MSSEILPSNSTWLERSLVDAGSEFINAASPNYAKYFDPYACPEEALPFLAHTLGLPIWHEAWSTDKKRHVLAEWPEIAGKLGTEDAIRWAVAVADGDLRLITVPPQAFYLAGDQQEDAAAWEQWLSGLPEIRLVRDRSDDIETGYVGELDFDDDIAGVGMFLGDEDDVATFFLGSLQTAERAFIVVGNEETEISFARRADPRYGKVGNVVDFYWFGDAGSGLYCDDPGSADLFIDGSPAIGTCATVSFGFGTGSADSWNMIAPTGFVQDVTPRLGEIYDEDGIGLFADDYWIDQFLDEIDPLRATYQAFRIIDGGQSWQMSGSYLDNDRFSMDAYTAELMTALPRTAPPAGLITDCSYFDDAHCLAASDEDDIDALCAAVSITKSHRDQVFIDLDVFTPNLSRIKTWDAINSLT